MSTILSLTVGHFNHEEVAASCSVSVKANGFMMTSFVHLPLSMTLFYMCTVAYLVLKVVLPVQVYREVAVFDAINPGGGYSSRIQPLGSFASGASLQQGIFAGDIPDPLYGNSGGTQERQALLAAVHQLRIACRGLLQRLLALHSRHVLTQSAAGVNAVSSSLLAVWCAASCSAPAACRRQKLAAEAACPAHQASIALKCCWCEWWGIKTDMHASMGARHTANKNVDNTVDKSVDMTVSCVACAHVSMNVSFD